MSMPETLDALVKEIRACKICAEALPHGPRPILHASATAKLAIVGQAPGVRAHDTNLSFNDPSGDRLRDWLGIDRDTFYDASAVAIVPMGFCFPGYNAEGHDKPPRKECATVWRARLFAALPEFPLILLVGTYAQAWHLGDRAKPRMAETVAAWREYAPRFVPLPHPSWRNNAWINKNPWFAEELLPYLRRRVRAVLGVRGTPPPNPRPQSSAIAEDRGARKKSKEPPRAKCARQKLNKSSRREGEEENKFDSTSPAPCGRGLGGWAPTR